MAAIYQSMGRVNRIKQKFDEYVVDLLLDFVTNMNPGDFSSTIKEYEVAGKLNAFLNYTDLEVNVYRGVAVGEQGKYRPGFILERNGRKVILELKRNLRLRGEQIATEQLLVYLQAARVNVGILFVFGTINKEYDIKIENINKDNMSYKLIKIIPRIS